MDSSSETFQNWTAVQWFETRTEDNLNAVETWLARTTSTYSTIGESGDLAGLATADTPIRLQLQTVRPDSFANRTSGVAHWTTMQGNLQRHSFAASGTGMFSGAAAASATEVRASKSGMEAEQSAAEPEPEASSSSINALVHDFRLQMNLEDRDTEAPMGEGQYCPQMTAYELQLQDTSEIVRMLRKRSSNLKHAKTAIDRQVSILIGKNELLINRLQEIESALEDEVTKRWRLETSIWYMANMSLNDSNLPKKTRAKGPPVLYALTISGCLGIR